MRVVVQPGTLRPHPRGREVRQSTIVEASREDLLALAENVSDPRLSSALRSLARRRSDTQKCKPS
jgi:hypothetical protein